MYYTTSRHLAKFFPSLHYALLVTYRAEIALSFAHALLLISRNDVLELYLTSVPPAPYQPW